MFDISIFEHDTEVFRSNFYICFVFFVSINIVSLFWELRDKRNLKNLQFWPKSLSTMLEYWCIEHGLLFKQQNLLKFLDEFSACSLRMKMRPLGNAFCPP